MQNEFQTRVQELLRHPRNQGEMADADAMATVGNAACGEMLRLWVKFKETEQGKVIDRATFDGYGCETAIALASLATDQIRGKTVAQALALTGPEFAGDLGPLPPLKIHCAQLVEAAVHDALSPPAAAPGPTPACLPAERRPPENLIDLFQRANSSGTNQRIVRLSSESQPGR
jgi:nitrogen fixation NifU-like protein